MDEHPKVTIQLNTTEQYFPVILFIMLYKMVLTFESVDEHPEVTIQLNTTEQYLTVCGAVCFQQNSIK